MAAYSYRRAGWEQLPFAEQQELGVERIREVEACSFELIVIRMEGLLVQP